MFAIYERVSTADGRQTITSQRDALRRFAFEKKTQWFSDQQTGTNFDRPGWSSMMEAIRAGTITTVACHRLDRLGRSASGLHAFFDELDSRGVNLISIMDGVNLETASGRLVAGVLASIAQFDNEVRRQRIMEGQARARSEGKRWGGSKPGRTTAKVDAKSEAVKTLRQAGESVSAIARSVGLSRPTVYRILGS